MSNIVKYAGLTVEALDQADQQVDAIAGGDFESIEVGENVFRFLPVPEGKGQAIRVTAMHYIDAIPGMNRIIVFACPRVELKAPCIACAKSEELMKTGNPLDRERAYRISAQLRVYANVINRKKPEAGPRVLAFGKMIWEALKAIRKNPRMGGDFTDPSQNGFDIVIMREGTGMNDTRYTCTPDRNNSPLAATPEEINYILEQTKDLNQFVNPTPAEELLLAWGATRGQLAGHGAMPSSVGQQVGRQAAPAPALQQGTVGAGIMDRARAAAQDAVGTRAPAAPARSAVQDAELDDDFNPIPKKA